ncbi:Hypothetical_protein [Hexamita inflata]|uniref:Hypothetical_protein n=1 Tax=Hexamita inflata TaxID=28002 RepID=A0AA86NBE2_9EUKA|nr:Hypothetical protein HINF_LOCUS3970 [Hexamita inflata]CAI9949972.1 Hypothetical protein HINF_LOCUS37617 [Hexamita inflata]
MGRHGGHHHSHHSHHTVHHYHGHSHHYRSSGNGRPEDPLYLYNNPQCWRVMSWIVPVAIITGIALIITFVVNEEDQQIGLIMGGGILLFYSIAVSVITSAKCCAVGSVRYYMLPCTMSQQELEALKNQCQAKHDAIFGVPVQVVQTNILNPVQVIPLAQPVMSQQNIYQTQVQPQILQSSQASTVEMIQKPYIAPEITISAVM